MCDVIIVEMIMFLSRGTSLIGRTEQVEGPAAIKSV